MGDEGGLIHPDFFPFVLRFRDSNNYPKNRNFYDFSGRVQKAPENGGVGTIAMHFAFDKVRYYRNTLGGLSVYLQHLKRR